MSKTKKILVTFMMIATVIFIAPITMKGLESFASVQAAKIAISTKSKTLHIGYGMKLNINGTNQKVSWSSSDAKVAKVTQGGYVTAKATGTATITGKVGGKKYQCTLTVNKAAKLNLYATRNMKLVGVTKKVTYQSSNKKIATIDKNGLVTAKKVGKVTITASTNNKKYTCELKVVADGWTTDTTGKVYYYKDGQPLKGWNYVGKYKYYFTKPYGILDQNVADRLTGKQNYYIHVNRKQCKITVFAEDGENGYTIPVLAMTCSVGTKEHATPTGTFSTMSKVRWGKLMLDSYGQYCTRIVGSILFHSVPGNTQSLYNISASVYNRLGTPASHGCIRLCVRDAKWIYDNCKLKTIVTIDDKEDGCKFAKPKGIKIKASQHYDPTDPNVKKK